LALLDFGGRLSDKAPKGSREMGLVEISQTANDVENGNFLSEQDSRISGTLDQSKRSVSNASRLQEVTLRGAEGEASRAPQQRVFNDGIACDDAGSDEAFTKVSALSKLG
jgi:hypothetical protein